MYRGERNGKYEIVEERSPAVPLVWLETENLLSSCEPVRWLFSSYLAKQSNLHVQSREI